MYVGNINQLPTSKTEIWCWRARELPHFLYCELMNVSSFLAGWLVSLKPFSATLVISQVCNLLIDLAECALETTGFTWSRYVSGQLHYQVTAT